MLNKNVYYIEGIFLKEDIGKVNLMVKEKEETKFSIYIKGFIPKKEVKKLSKINCYAKIKETKEGVTYLDNPFPINIFQPLVRMYVALPYNSVDPTFFYFIFFPIIFGLMTANFYDAIIIFISSILAYKLAKIKIAKVIAYSSIFSMLFGIAIGESPFNVELIDVKTSVLFLFKLSLYIGIAHIFCGFLIRLTNNLLRKRYKKCIESFGYLLLTSLIFISLCFGFSKEQVIFYAISLILILTKKENLIEIPKLIGNILSYGRILAIFLVHYFMVSSFITLDNRIIAISLTLFGHLINLSIGLLIAFVHTLRLHYVEFSTKFMEEQGEWFINNVKNLNE